MSKKKTLVEGAFGLKLPEQTARYLDALLKTLPQECRTLKRKTSVAASSEFLQGEKADVSWITTDDVDKEGEIVLPGGIDLQQYRSNPVVLWNHDTASPIGRAQWIKLVDNGIKAKTQYATRPETHVGEWLPDTIFALVQQQVLKGRSIGFIPLQIDSPTQEQIKTRPDWKEANAIITKSVLFEFSVVSIPCNGSALLEACSKGIRLDTLKKLGLKVPQAKQVSLNEILRQIDTKKIAQQVYDTFAKRGLV